MPKRKMIKYELITFDSSGQQLEGSIIEVGSDSGVIGRAGTLCKRNGGPVDLARDGDEPWDERYITTISPSAFHQKGYRCERLS